MATSQKLKKLLQDGFVWPEELQTGVAYSRLQDDHDGEFEGRVIVSFSMDGDAWVDIDVPRRTTMRFRSGFGGSRSPRVHNALILLALAIKLDSEERPDPVPQG